MLFRAMGVNALALFASAGALHMTGNTVIGFLVLTAVETLMGVDNAVVIGFGIDSLKLEERAKKRVLLISLIIAGAIRVGMIALLNLISGLTTPLGTFLPEGTPEILRSVLDSATGMQALLFAGGLLVIVMAFVHYVEKERDAKNGQAGHKTVSNAPAKRGFLQIIGLTLYLLVMSVLFSLDSCLTAVATMDIERDFWWMASAIAISTVIMIFGMGPLSRALEKSHDVAVIMLAILCLIGSFLVAEGAGHHVPQWILWLCIGLMTAVEYFQVRLRRAHESGANAS